MKQIATLIKALANTTAEQLAGIIACENVDAAALTDNERLSVLVFDELAHALKVKDAQLVLDANYAQSKFHDSDQYLVDYFRLVSNDTKNATMIQFYVHANAKRETVDFRLCTSCARVNREQFAALEAELHFVTKYDKKTGRAKTTERKDVGYADIVDVVKRVCAVLASTKQATQAEQPKA